MSLSASDFSDGLKAIGFLKTEAEAEQKWTDAWEKFITNCTQVSSASPGVSAFKSSISGAFAPTKSTTEFVKSLEKAMDAGIQAVVLTTNSGTIVPTPYGPLGYTPAPAKTNATPRDDLGEKVNTWTKTYTVTGISPDFSGAGPLS